MSGKVAVRIRYRDFKGWEGVNEEDCIFDGHVFSNAPVGVGASVISQLVPLKMADCGQSALGLLTANHISCYTRQYCMHACTCVYCMHVRVSIACMHVRVSIGCHTCEAQITFLTLHHTSFAHSVLESE